MLLYCMTDAEAAPESAPEAGVRGAAVESLTEAGVRCFFSRVEDLPKNAELLRSHALQFHAVLKNLLQHTTVLPFRFPTLLEDEKQIRDFLSASGSEHLRHLKRLRGSVQVELRILSEPEASWAHSGKDYLERRAAEEHVLQSHIDAVLSRVRELAQEWKTRREPRGTRCYALVRREQVEAFEERLRTLSPVKGARIIVSGPWPPTEFMNVPNP